MALEKGHLLNCYIEYNKIVAKTPTVPWLYIGYMEACLVQFEAIESKNNGLGDYRVKVKAHFGRRWEDRDETVVRLTEDYLKKEGLLKD